MPDDTADYIAMLERTQIPEDHPLIQRLDNAISCASMVLNDASTPCLICGAPVYDYDPKYCCNGYDCGCMGQPTEPCVCSEKCSKALFDGIGRGYEERRINAGIDKYQKRHATVDELVQLLEERGLGWSLDHTGHLIEARVWDWPYVIGRHRPETVLPLAEMLAKAMYEVDWTKYPKIK